MIKRKWQQNILIYIFSIVISINSLKAECDNAARVAAMESGVPLEILMAIARIETGRPLGDEISPWPWTLNEGGNGKFFPDRQQAFEHLNMRLNGGTRNVDIGCFQINFRWHRENFRTVSEMLDPISNARYAAKFLRNNYAESQDWIDAAGKFHSRTPELAKVYIRRLRVLINQAPHITSKIGRSYSLMRSVTQMSVASLLRSGPDLGNLLSAPTRRLFGD